MKKIILVCVTAVALGLSGCSSKNNASGNQKFVPLEVINEMQAEQQKAELLNKKAAVLNKQIIQKEKQLEQLQNRINEMNAIIEQAK